MTDEYRTDVKLMVGTPVYSGTTASYTNRLMETWADLREAKIWKKWEVSDGVSDISAARDIIAHRFDQMKEYTHLFWIDSDLQWERQVFLDMVKLAKDIDFLVAPVPTRRLLIDRYEEKMKSGDKNPRRWLYDWNFRPLPGVKTAADFQGIIDVDRGVMKVGGAGIAFACISRRVFDRIKEALNEGEPELFDGMTYTSSESGELAYSYFLPFCRNGQRYSEDFAFCQRWLDLGGDIWMMLGGRFIHEGPFKLSANYAEWVTGYADEVVAAEIERMKPLIITP